MNRTARIVAGVASLAAMAAVTMSAAPTQQAAETAQELAGELCTRVRAGGPAIEIVGPQIRWSVPAVDLDTKAAMLSFIRRVSTAQGFLIDANGTWIAVQNVETRTTVLVDCRGGDPFTTTESFRTAEIAVSQMGDLAVRTEAGDVLLSPRTDASTAQRTWSAPVNRTRAAGRLVWLDRRLVVIDAGHTYAIDLSETAFWTTDLFVSGLPDTIIAAWAYRGLTFVMGDDGCIDMLADTTLVPHLRRAACAPSPQAGGAYIGFDAETTRVFTRQGEMIWEGSRLLALSAKLTGTVREITANLLTIARASWAPAVPVAMGAPIPPRPPVPPAESSWATIVEPRLWPTPAAFDAGIAALDGKGWSGFRNDGGWTTGTGIAVRWQTGPDFVTPAGRTLTAIAQELYFEQAYRDDQIENLLTANASLGRSLEGRLFDLGWIPVGAAFGSTSLTPLAMTGAGSIGNLLADPKRTLEGPARTAVEPFKTLKSVTSCRFDDPAVDEPVARMVGVGISVLGRSGVSQAISRSTNPQLKAASALVVRCTNAQGVQLRLLLLRNALLDSEEGRARARAGVAIGSSGNALTFGATQDGSWPVGIQSDAIVAVGLAAPIDGALRAAFLRPWLDDLFKYGRVNRVILRVSYLEVVVAATASWQPRTESLPAVRLVPAERVSSGGRSLSGQKPGCTVEGALLEQQKLFDALLQLNAVPPTERLADLPIVGVVESLVMRSNPMFTRRDGESAWQVLSDQSRFTPLAEDRPVSVDERSLHGTRVAGLIFSAVAPTGVLSDARLTWIDESSPDTNILTKLAGTAEIVNFSRRLHDGWANLLPQARDSWISSLFVAAAHNKDERARLTVEQEALENQDGMPISWGLANTIGVGVADAHGKTSEKTLRSYAREQVDLLAPGYLVPAAGPAPEQPLCLDGTSYATAYVSAVAAMLQQKAQGLLTPSQLRARLLSTATWQPDYWEHVKGGLVNAARALDGLFDNVLTFARPDDPRSPGLQVVVKLPEKQFIATGEEFGSPRETLPVFWSDVLRLTRTGEIIDASGRTQSQFYMAFVDNRHYRVWRNVTISSATSAMPISQCTRRSDNLALTCTATDVNNVFDYVGQRYRPGDKIKVF